MSCFPLFPAVDWMCEKDSLDKMKKLMRCVRPKIICFLFLLCLSASLFSFDVKTFCDHYFNSSEYTVVTKTYEETDVIFAFNFSGGGNKYVDRLIGFYIEDEALFPVIYIDSFRIENGEEIIANNPLPNNSFYAWKVEFYKTGLYVIPYGNSGKSVTDGITIDWDNSSKIMKKWKRNKEY